MKRVYPSESVKYLSVKNDESHKWKDQTHDIVTNALLYRIRKYVSLSKILQKKALRILNNQPRNSH